jgi:hypothetical protein
MGSLLLVVLLYVAFNTNIRYLQSSYADVLALALQLSSSDAFTIPPWGLKQNFEDFAELVDELIQPIERYFVGAKSTGRSRDQRDLTKLLGQIEDLLNLSSCKSTDDGGLLECSKTKCQSDSKCREALESSDYLQELLQLPSINSKAFDIAELRDCNSNICLSPRSLSLSLQSATHPQTILVSNREDKALQVSVEYYDDKFLDLTVLKQFIGPRETVFALQVQVKLREAKLGSTSSLSYDDLEAKRQAQAFIRAHSPSAVTLSLCEINGVCHLKTLEIEVKTKFIDTKQLDYGTLPVNSHEASFISIQNPFATSLAFKVFIGHPLDDVRSMISDCSSHPQLYRHHQETAQALDSLAKQQAQKQSYRDELGLFPTRHPKDTHSSHKSPSLDEEEFEYSTRPNAKSKACQAFMGTEFMRPLHNKAQSARLRPLTDLTLLGKTWAVLASVVQPLLPRAPSPTSPPFHLDDNGMQVLGPGETAVIGPVVCSPSVAGWHDATLYIKNNHTIIETVSLFAAAELPTVLLQLPGKSSVSITIEWDDLISQMTLAYDDQHYPIFKFPVYAELVNPNNLPVTVYSLLVGGSGCSDFDLTIKDCQAQFTLQAKETLKLAMQFSPRFYQEVSVITLWIVTEAGVQTADVELKMPFLMLSYVRWRRFNWLIWDWPQLVMTELVIVLSAVLGGGVFTLVIWMDLTLMWEPELITKPQSCKASDNLDSSSTGVHEAADKDSPSPPKSETAPDVEAFSLSGTSARPASEELAAFEVPAPEPVMTSKQPKAPKKKIKEAKIHSEFKAKKLPKLSSSEPKVVATNQFILLTKSRALKHATPPLVPSPPPLTEPLCRLLSSYGSPDVTEETYLDSYKLNKLFSGPAYEATSLQELLSS